MNISSTSFIRDDYWPDNDTNRLTNMASTPFIRDDYCLDYNDIYQLNQRIDETQSELALVNANLTNDIENVFNNLNIYVGEQADTSISNNIIVNNLNANYAEGRFANFDNTFTNNAYIENLTVNKPAFDITLNTPHLENTTSLNGNFYSPNIIDARLIGDVSGDLNVVNVNQLNAVNAVIANLFVNHSAPPINACSVLGYDREGRVIPVYATYNVNFPEDADYVWTDFAGTSRKGIKATEIGEVDNLITAYGVKNAIDIVNADLNSINNRIETEIANLAVSFSTDELSANNAVIVNLDVDNLSANNTVVVNLNVDNLSANNAVTNNLSAENTVTNNLNANNAVTVNFSTDNLSANNTVTNNLDVSDITVEKTPGKDGQVIGKTSGKVKWTNAVDFVSKGILDIMWPIGVVYTQYPQQKSPQELFPGTTWVVVDYGGAFFRASGGSAAAFNGGKQGQSIQSHNHSFSWSGSHSHPITDPKHDHGIPTSSQHSATAGLVYTTKHVDGRTDGVTLVNYSTRSSTTGISIDSTEISIETSTGSDGGEETRPANFTIRIWKRTA